MRKFIIMWFGQLVSVLGSALTQFALAVYIYQKTGSSTQLGLSLLAGTLPFILFAPFAGALVDRWNRKWVILAADLGAGVSTLTIWVLLSAGRLEIWHIYAVIGALGIFSTLHYPAYQAAITQLVPRQHYGRTAGMNQLRDALSQIVAPMLAGFLMVSIEVKGLILIDFATYLVAIATLLAINIPKQAVTAEGITARGSLVKEAAFGWLYIKARPGLLGLLGLFALVNFALGFQGVLFTPLVLSFSNAGVLGNILSFSGLGLLAGSLLMSTWGGTRRKVYSLLAGIFFLGVTTMLVGLRADVIFIGAASFVFALMLPVANGSSQAIWQAKVAPDIQGRVFSIRALIANIAAPLAYLLAGPLADALFEPAMAEGGFLSSTVGGIIGNGAGRGIGVIFILMGLLICVATLLCLFNPGVVHVEDEQPGFTAGTIRDFNQAEVMENV